MNQPVKQPTDPEESYQRTYACCMRLLAAREHSVLELQRKLSKREFPESVIEVVLEELRDQNLQSDQRFADVFVHSRFEHGYGPSRIRAELRERGVNEGWSDAPFSELSGLWVDAASQQREKRFGRCLPQVFKDQAKQMRFLQQRGYTGDQIRAVFQQ